MTKGLAIHDLLPAIIVVVVIVLAMAFSSSILASIQQGQCTVYNATTGTCTAAGTTVASNITGYGLSAVTNISQQLPNIGLIIIVAVIIGILVGSFLVYQRQ